MNQLRNLRSDINSQIHKTTSDQVFHQPVSQRFKVKVSFHQLAQVIQRSKSVKNDFTLKQLLRLINVLKLIEIICHTCSSDYWVGPVPILIYTKAVTTVRQIGHLLFCMRTIYEHG